MDKNILLQQLPPYLDRRVIIKRNQGVYDIVKEVLEAHQIFAPDYDLIATNFEQSSNVETARKIFDFLKKNVEYEIETEESQSTKSPSALLQQGYGDCKHYAGFIAGVLDALNRKGRRINWSYRFASYTFWNNLPEHVFVVLFENGKEIWIDPVLKYFNERLEPTYILDKKIKNDMLQRISGINDFTFVDSVLDDEDKDLSPELLSAITLLLQYKVLNTEGEVNDTLLNQLSTTLPQDVFKQLADARVLIAQQVLGGLFKNVFRGVKKVVLAVPRNAYLSLVALNVRGMATNLYNKVFLPDGSESGNQGKIYSIWNGLGGDWVALANAIKSGAKKKAFLAGTNSVGIAIPALLAAAVPVIVAIANALKGMKDTNTQYQANLTPGIDTTGITTPTTTNTSSPLSFLTNNPMMIAAIAAVGFYLYSNRKKK